MSVPLIPALVKKGFPQTHQDWWDELKRRFKRASRGVLQPPKDANGSDLGILMKTEEGRTLLWYLWHDPEKSLPDPYRRFLAGDWYDGKVGSLARHIARLVEAQASFALVEVKDLVSSATKKSAKRRETLLRRPARGPVVNPRIYVIHRLYNLLRAELRVKESAIYLSLYEILGKEAVGEGDSINGSERLRKMVRDAQKYISIHAPRTRSGS